MAETIQLTAPPGKKVHSWAEGRSTARDEEAPLDVSVLVPVLDESATVSALAERVLANLDAIDVRAELVFIDDGSTDGTSDAVRREHQRDPRVRLIRLRRNFGKAAALSAGVDHSRGRILVTMDGDLQDDPDEIP
ncbi:MAG: glycosyltransferase, partial [Acidobacteriota bacterium]|nr:glycosyltransferase [Acidobacteriota bacterium]